MSGEAVDAWLSVTRRKEEVVDMHAMELKQGEEAREGEASVAEALVKESHRALTRAAELAVQVGADLDTFLTVARAAYLQANPAVREQLESMHLLVHMAHLRQRGLVGEA